MRNANHVSRPTIITEPGQYVTRGGEVVTVATIDRYNAHGQYPSGIEERWDICGRLYASMLSDNDIVSRV